MIVHSSKARTGWQSSPVSEIDILANKHPVKRVWSVIWRCGLLFVLWGILYAPFVLPYFLYWTEHELLTRPQGQLFIELAAAATIFLAAWGLTRYVDRQSLTKLGLAPRGTLQGLTAGTAIGFVLTGTIILTLFLLGWLLFFKDGAVTLAPLLWAAVILLVNTFTQEFMVRGYMLPLLRERFGAVPAILTTSVLFVAMHAGVLNASSVLPMLNLFLAGILLGVAFVVAGNLWLPLGIHFGWNYLQGPVLGLHVTGQDIGNGWQLAQLDGPSLYAGGGFGIEGSIVATVVLALGILGLIAAYPASWQSRNRISHQPARSLI